MRSALDNKKQTDWFKKKTFNLSAEILNSKQRLLTSLADLFTQYFVSNLIILL